MTKYIEARSGARFAVRLKIDGDDFFFPDQDMEIRVLVDGKAEDICFYGQEDRHDPEGQFIEGCFTSLSSQVSVLQHFRFAALEIGRWLKAHCASHFFKIDDIMLQWKPRIQRVKKR